MCVIYYIENTLTGQFYIGSTNNYRRRCNQHSSELNCNKHPNRKLQSIYNKYGKNIFKFGVLEEVLDSIDLIPREQYYLDLLKPYYNLLPVAGRPVGTVHSENAKMKMSFYAKNRTKEHLLKLAKAFGKPVNQYTLDGNLIATYWSASEAARQTGLRNSQIIRVCRGTRKKHGGFIWTYAASFS